MFYTMDLIGGTNSKLAEWGSGIITSYMTVLVYAPWNFFVKHHVL